MVYTYLTAFLNVFGLVFQEVLIEKSLRFAKIKNVCYADGAMGRLAKNFVYLFTLILVTFAPYMKEGLCPM